MGINHLKPIAIGLVAAVVLVSPACSAKKKTSSDQSAESTPESTPTPTPTTPTPSTGDAKGDCKVSTSTDTDTDTTDTSTDSSASLASSTSTKTSTDTSTACPETAEVPDTTTPGDETPDVKIRAECAAAGKPILFQKSPAEPICHEGVKLIAKGSDWCTAVSGIKTRFQKAPYNAGAAIETAYNSYTTAGEGEKQGFTLDQCGEFADGRPIIYLIKQITNADGTSGPKQVQLKASSPK